MTRGALNNLVVAYDIADPLRLQRVHHHLCKWGIPLQYSLFYCQLDMRDRRRLEALLRGLIDERADDVRVYGIKSLNDIEFIGRKPLPAGVTITSGHDSL
ncbi:MAG TPA: CRISPR-associated endonuclease Cas2 [Nevskiaceae bacterium]